MLYFCYRKKYTKDSKLLLTQNEMNKVQNSFDRASEELGYGLFRNNEKVSSAKESLALFQFLRTGKEETFNKLKKIIDSSKEELVGKN